MLRVLVVGCGAVGGYFGARLAQSGQAQVTFLVRTAAKARNLREHGLWIRSTFTGDLMLASVRATHDIAEEEEEEGYDVVVVTCKAPGLDSVLEALRRYPYSERRSFLVLPLLNGMAHFDKLDAEFGRARVLGGVARISTVLVEEKENEDAHGVTIVNHLSPAHSLIFGSRGGDGVGNGSRAHCDRLLQALLASGVGAELTQDIELDLWEKFVTLTTLASATCLVRGNMGQVVRAEEGARVVTRLLAECCSASPVRLREDKLDFYRQLFLNDPQSVLTSSMWRDLQQGKRTEARYIVRDMLQRVRATKGGGDLGEPHMLSACWLVLEVYENQLDRLD